MSAGASVPALAQVLPVTTDHDSAEVFAAAARGELVVAQCPRCHTVAHLPRAYCRNCAYPQTQWRVVGESARLVSWTVVEHQVHPAFPVPYTVVLVELDDPAGVRFIGRLSGRPPLRPGAPMRVHFERLDADTVIPQWHLAESAPDPEGSL